MIDMNTSLNHIISKKEENLTVGFRLNKVFKKWLVKKIKKNLHDVIKCDL